MPATWIGPDGKPLACEGPCDVPCPPGDMPRELMKTSLPDYTIEPPDVLLIDVVKVVPRPPYRMD